jgi:DNA-binding winged helix-turn-helix (wHTH) protein
MHQKENDPPVIRFGSFTLDGRSGELRNGPTRLKVPDQSISVLQALLERPGELVTREALRDRLWGPETFVDFEAGLNAAVRRLREALNDSADGPRYVETLPRRGYRFIAPVDGTLPAPAALVGGEAPVSAHSETARGGRVRLRHVVLWRPTTPSRAGRTTVASSWCVTVLGSRNSARARLAARAWRRRQRVPR